MTFESELLIGSIAAAVAFVILTAITIYRQRTRRRRSVHVFAIFILSAVIGAGVGIGVHLSGTAPLDPGEINVDTI